MDFPDNRVKFLVKFCAYLRIFLLLSSPFAFNTLNKTLLIWEGISSYVFSIVPAGATVIFMCVTV